MYDDRIEKLYGSPTCSVTSTSLSIVLDAPSDVGLGSASGVTSKLTVGGACISVSMGSGDPGREVGGGDSGGKGFGPGRDGSTATGTHSAFIHNINFMFILNHTYLSWHCIFAFKLQLLQQAAASSFWKAYPY